MRRTSKADSQFFSFPFSSFSCKVVTGIIVISFEVSSCISPYSSFFFFPIERQNTNYAKTLFTRCLSVVVVVVVAAVAVAVIVVANSIFGNLTPLR